MALVRVGAIVVFLLILVENRRFGRRCWGGAFGVCETFDLKCARACDVLWCVDVNICETVGEQRQFGIVLLAFCEEKIGVEAASKLENCWLRLLCLLRIHLLPVFTRKQIFENG